MLPVTNKAPSAASATSSPPPNPARRFLEHECARRAVLHEDDVLERANIGRVPGDDHTAHDANVDNPIETDWRAKPILK
jgi:hypothetical protein